MPSETQPPQWAQQAGADIAHSVAVAISQWAGGPVQQVDQDAAAKSYARMIAEYAAPAIAEAVAAERDQCARVAEQPLWSDANARLAAGHIADAIRARTPDTPDTEGRHE